MNLVKFNGLEVRTTSKIVADVFGKAHRKVCRDIEKLECSEEFHKANFGRSEYTTDRGKTYKCYTITRDGFSFLCMGFTGSKAAKWKESYINAFNSMENGMLNIDARMQKLSIEGDKIKEAGKEWSALGHEINTQKKLHLKKVNELIDQVQFKLDIK